MKISASLLQNPKVIDSGRDGLLVWLELLAIIRRKGLDSGIVGPDHASPQNLSRLLVGWRMRPHKIEKALERLEAVGLIELAPCEAAQGPLEGAPDDAEKDQVRSAKEPFARRTSSKTADFGARAVRVVGWDESWICAKTGAERTAKWRAQSKRQQELAPLFEGPGAGADVTPAASHEKTRRDASVTPRESEREREGGVQRPPSISRSTAKGARPKVELRIERLDDLARSHWQALRRAGLFAKPRREHERLDLAELLAEQGAGLDELEALVELSLGRQTVPPSLEQSRKLAEALSSPERRRAGLRTIETRKDTNGHTGSERRLLEARSRELSDATGEDEGWLRRAFEAQRWHEALERGETKLEDVPIVVRKLIWDEEPHRRASRPDPETSDGREALHELEARNAEHARRNRPPLPWEREQA